MDSRHPLVIVLVIAVIGIGFYYNASPYENCKREAHSKYSESEPISLKIAMNGCRKSPW
jgi:hypothetical protein